MIKLYQKLQTIAKRYIFNVLCLFLPKGTAEPLHEMLSMKLPAELFELVPIAKNKNKRDRKLSFFACLGLGQRPKNKKNCLKRGTN